MSLGAFSLVLVQELRVESTNIIYVKSDNKHASDFQTLKLESYEEGGAPW